MSFDLVVLGGTGDLACRKLMPALLQSWRHGKLPGGGRLLAVGREPHDTSGYRAWLAERFAHLFSDPAAEARGWQLRGSLVAGRCHGPWRRSLPGSRRPGDVDS